MEGRRIIFLTLFLLLTGCVTPPITGQPDLFVDAVSARATADAAVQQAQLQEEYLTATARSPIIHITETAAAQSAQSTSVAEAMAIQNQYWTVTAQSVQETQTSAMTQTAMAWTPTPNATSTAVAVLAIAESTRMANDTERNNLELERQRVMNQILAVSPYVVGLAALISALMFIIVFAKRLSFMPHTMDERGKVIPMIGVIEGVAWDMDKAANGMIGTTQKFLAQLPAVTAARQDTVTARALMMDMATRARLPRKLLNELDQELLPAPGQSIETNFLLPAWEIINGWDGKHGIPYYTARGLEIIDIERFPHLSAIGATGAGKSRRFFRPLIACALASGHRVVIIGKSADYWAFEGHPNATLLKVNKITEQGQAERYAKILEAVVVEMNRRDDVLTSTHQSTWTHAGRSRTFIVLDEVGNALRLMDRDTSNQSRIWIEGLVSESRKVGFNIVIANQRATGMASILSQTGKAIFRVEADEERAHRSLAGASTLMDGYFLAKFGVPKIAGAFEPTDDEIRAFLSSRPVDKVEDEDQWIEGVVSDAPPKLTEQKSYNDTPPSLAELVASLDSKSMRVLELYQTGGMSDSEIAEQAYGYSNGTIVRRVKSLIERYRDLTTTTQNLPNLGAVAA